MDAPRHLLLPALVLAAALLGACGGDDDAAAPEPTEQPSSSEAGDTGDAPEGGDTVTLERSRFDPKELEVEAGTEVTFENVDPYAHTVTSAEGSDVEFDSGEFGQDETFSQSFDEAGTYEYFCEIHPTMKGTVVVS